MASVGAVNFNDTYALRQASGMFAKGSAEQSTEKNKGWNEAAVAAGYAPQVQTPGVQKLQPTEKVGQTGAVAEGSSPAAIASIGARGMRAYDTEMGVNQPMAMGTFHRGQQTGVVGGSLRILG